MPKRPLLMIPGPIEFEPEVLAAMATPSPSHMDLDFARVFGRALVHMREVFRAPTGQPFAIAGTGTLAMELAAANVVEAGDRVVVVNTGFFGDRMGRIIERLGATAEHVRAPIGEVPSLEAIEQAVSRGPCKAVAVTHVDTSTAVLTPVEAIAKIGKKHGALVIVDGVCATGGEALEQDAWGVDVALTASQKAIGVPPGLALVVASAAAVQVVKTRKTKVASLYLDLNEWLPIMEGYEKSAPLYFATPAVNLIAALAVSLDRIVAEGIEARVARHRRVASAFRAAWKALGLSMLPKSDAVAANTMSALWYPEGTDASFVGRAKTEGVILAGGLHPDAKTKYFRVGHMGVADAAETVATVAAIERALRGGQAGSARRVELGIGVAAAQEILLAKT
jgi:alanine-glyoxylate transaminase/serine-glyoxylate transaminase/serine-pyruvate transaminase